MTHDFLADEAAFAKFLDQFEQGTLPRPQWTHAAHLAVGAWFLLSLPERKAIERVRAGIQHYNECAGIRNTPDSGYHESLTLFWLAILKSLLSGAHRGVDKLDAVRRSVAEFGSRRDLFREWPSVVADMLLNAWAAAAGQPAFVSSTVAEVTGAPPRTFLEWAMEHAASFREPMAARIRTIV
jgi:hypothetical protein